MAQVDYAAAKVILRLQTEQWLSLGAMMDIADFIPPEQGYRHAEAKRAYRLRSRESAWETGDDLPQRSQRTRDASVIIASGQRDMLRRLLERFAREKRQENGRVEYRGTKVTVDKRRGSYHTQPIGPQTSGQEREKLLGAIRSSDLVTRFVERAELNTYERVELRRFIRDVQEWLDSATQALAKAEAEAERVDELRRRERLPLQAAAD